MLTEPGPNSPPHSLRSFSSSDRIITKLCPKWLPGPAEGRRGAGLFTRGGGLGGEETRPPGPARAKGGAHARSLGKPYKIAARATAYQRLFGTLARIRQFSYACVSVYRSVGVKLCSARSATLSSTLCSLGRSPIGTTPGVIIAR